MKLSEMLTKIGRFFSPVSTCPECGVGELKPVYGWNKEECDKCNYTRNV